MFSQGKSTIKKWLPALAAFAFISATLLLGGYQFLLKAPELKAASHGKDSVPTDSEEPANIPFLGPPPGAPDMKKADATAEPGRQSEKTKVPWWKKRRRRAVSSDPPEAEPKPETEKTEPPAAAETKPDAGPKPDAAAVSKQAPKPEPPPAKMVDFTPPTKKMEWGTGYKSWPAVSGFVSTRFHGERIVQTHIFPVEAVEIFNDNARNARLRKKTGFRRFPPGTIIAQKSWARNSLGGPGKEGPMFLMRKEPSGYDTENGDWQYVLANKDFNIIGEGSSAQVVPCKQCHGSVKNRDYVFASQF